MKKIIGFGMAALMGMSLAACAGAQSSASSAAAEVSSAAAEVSSAAAEVNSVVADASSAVESISEEISEITGAGVATEGKLYMATNAEFPPYEYHEGDAIVGIDAEIAEAIAKEMGLELVIEDIAFDSIIPEIVSGKADIGMAGMTVTEERKQSVDFSDTYTTASQVIIVAQDSKITGSADLEGKIVGVQLGTTGDIFASDIKDASVERYNKGMEAVQALTQGKVDAVVIDSQVAQAFVEQTEGIKILDEAFTVEEYAIAVKKGNTELLNNVNAALAKLKADGTIDEIINKYISAE